MASQKELDDCYMDVAHSHAKLSKSLRKKVGCTIVTTNGVLLCGVNGRAPGGSNVCESTDFKGELVTRPETIHAELSCILKAAREGVSVVGGTLYTTLSCCVPCSEMIAAAGIKRVVYDEMYRDSSGVNNLKNLKISVEKYENNA